MTIVGGNKGGVGKSAVSAGLIHLLRIACYTNIAIIDADDSNPDIRKSHQAEYPECHSFSLDDANGWITLVNLMEQKSDHTFVINQAARNQKGSKFSSTLFGSIDELKREVEVLWVINRQRDSINLLLDFLDAQPNAVVHVVLNEHFGDQSKFTLFNGAKELIKTITDRGGKILVFPDLADTVADDLLNKRLSISAGYEQSPIGNRAEIKRWVNELEKNFASIIHISK